MKHWRQIIIAATLLAWCYNTSADETILNIKLIMGINYLAAAYCTYYALPFLKKSNPGGEIVNMLSQKIVLMCTIPVFDFR